MNRLTQTHRAQQLLLRRVTIARLEAVWPALDWAALDESFPGFAVRVAAVVEANRRVSAGLAAGYLRALRREQGVPGELVPVAVAPLVVDQFQAVLHSTSVAAVKSSVSRGVAADVAMGNARSLSSGAMSRLVLDAGRDTVTGTVAKDSRARGWRRVLGGGGCDFCRGKAGVGMTSDVVFESHDKCGCTAEPVYRS